MPLDSTSVVVWDNEAIDAGEFSDPVSIASGARVRVMGHCSAATVLDVYFSHNNQQYYRSEFSIQIGGEDDFNKAFDVEVSYMKLKSSEAVTIKAVVVKKITSIL